MKNIKSELTAISRTTLSKPYKLFLSQNIINKNQSILDFGCGKGFDVKTLQNKGFDIKGYDKYQNDFKNSYDVNYDIVTCNYVFNVISEVNERIELLNELKKIGKKIIISVRSDKKAIKENWIEYNDGYITPRKTFQKFYTEDDIINFFGDVEFLYNKSDSKIFTIK